MNKLAFVLSLVLSLSSLVISLSADEMPYSYVLMDADHSTLLYSENGNYVFSPYHSAKLMTTLLAAEAVEQGSLSLDATVTTSAYANSMQGTQIWLKAGEEITVGELLLSVTAGNANDACVALCEAVASNEENFVCLMNERAKDLGMLDTFFADSTGISSKSYTTASDVAILASALSKYTWLDEYFCTYITYVRNGQTQLVNTNRLVRTFDGAVGMKYYYRDDTQNCVVALARKNGMSLICVIFGEPDKDALFKTAKEKLTLGFSAYTIYTPSPYDVCCSPVKVKKSISQTVETTLSELSDFVVRKSKIDSVKIRTEYFDDIVAPVSKGDKVGRVLYEIDGETVYSADIVAAEDAKRITFWNAMKRLLTQFAKL